MNRALAAALAAILLPLLGLTLGTGLLISGTATACPTLTGTTPTRTTPSLAIPTHTAISPTPDGERSPAAGPGTEAMPIELRRLAANPDCLTGAGDGLPDVTAAPVASNQVLPPDTPSTIQVAIAWARAQLGTPYSYGGDCTAPHSGNPAHQCDCSSLVQQAYAHAGIGIPRTTYQQVNAGTPVTDLINLRPGDLIFIPGAHGTRTRPGHVGLYLGTASIIEAPHTGAVVRITPLRKWGKQVTARRLVASL